MGAPARTAAAGLTCNLPLSWWIEAGWSSTRDDAGRQPQVELETGQVSGGPGGDRGVPSQLVGGGLVANLDVIIDDVVTAVA